MSQFVLPAPYSLAISMNDTDLMILATYNNPHEANVLKLRLESHGVSAVIANENTSALFGATIAGPSSAFWIEVLICAKDAEVALHIKETFNSEYVADRHEIEEWQCACGETVDAGFAVCWSCGKDLPGDH